MQRLYPAKGTKYLADLINRKLKIVHPYGVVGELEWQGGGSSVQFGAKGDSYDLAKLSAGIRTYNEEVEDKNKINEVRDHDGDRVRLITRGGYNWTDRYPWIVGAALKNKPFVIDGEAVVLGVDGVPDFNALHSRKHDAEVQLYAFDILALDGDDLRGLPLHLRKTSLDALREPAAGAYCPTKGSFDPLR